MKLGDDDCDDLWWGTQTLPPPALAWFDDIDDLKSRVRTGDLGAVLELGRRSMRAMAMHLRSSRPPAND